MSMQEAWKTIHPEDRGMVHSHLQSVLAGPDRTASYDYRAFSSSADERILHGELKAILGENGTPIRVVGTAQDVTEARRTQAELERNQRMLTDAQRIAGMGSYEVELPGGEMHWSKGLYALFGLDPAKHKPSTELFNSLLHPDDLAFVQKRAESLWAGDTVQEIFEWRIPGRDGTERLFHAEIEPERDKAGHLTRIIGTVQDVTAQRNTERELQRALEEAKAANKAKSEFLMNMSHELRTPLNAVIGFSELLLNDVPETLTPEQRMEYLTDIHDSGQHLLDIIGGILDLSKVESGRTVLDEDVFDLQDAISWTHRLVAETAREAGLALEVDAGADLPGFRGDERLIRQAVLNLVSNAIKFTQSGGWVRIQATRDDTGDVAIIVADSGIGMRSEDLAVALSPFGQVESSLTRNFEGTGLGLPLAQKFVELHGGELTIESRPRQGTTVTIKLPQSRLVADPG